MGTVEMEIRIKGLASSHNSAKDYYDRSLWALLDARIRMWIEQDPDLNKLVTMIEGPEQ